MVKKSITLMIDMIIPEGNGIICSTFCVGVRAVDGYGFLPPPHSSLAFYIT